ncbi:MAG: VOC family protein [Phycisphaerales bacterium]|nr:VOC family protein [Phycisphaerales bacterium]
MAACPVVHFEFWSKDAAKCADFYKQVFDWDINFYPEMNDYHLVNAAPPGIGGGIMTPKQGEWPAAMTMYISVDDLKTYCDKIKAAGGQIIVDNMEIPDVGWLSLFKDPDGRVIGLWKQGPGPK